MPFSAAFIEKSEGIPFIKMAWPIRLKKRVVASGVTRFLGWENDTYSRIFLQMKKFGGDFRGNARKTF